MPKGCAPWKGPVLKQFLKSCSLQAGPALERSVHERLFMKSAHKELFPVGGNPCGTGEKQG